MAITYYYKILTARRNINGLALKDKKYKFRESKVQTGFEIFAKWASFKYRINNEAKSSYSAWRNKLQLPIVQLIKKKKLYSFWNGSIALITVTCLFPKQGYELWYFLFKKTV